MTIQASSKPETISNFRHNLVYEDLRGWIAEAERLDELKTVTGASWQQDIGLACTLVKY